MIEYAIAVKYAENKWCHDRGFEGWMEPLASSITTDWQEAQLHLKQTLERIEARKKTYPYVEETAKIVLHEVTPWCDVAMKS